MKIVKQFGKNLRNLRDKQGLSLRGLAEKAEIGHNTIAQIENKGVDPHLSVLLALSKGFGQNIHEFLKSCGL